MRARFIVRGRVQGVYFRAGTREVGDRLGLRIEVWNRQDGAVECRAEGSPAGLDELERWLLQGPPLARVEAVERADEG